VSVEGGGVCAECGCALDGTQRYCVECGARVGARSPQLERLLAGAPAQPAPGATSPAPATATSATAARGGLTLPPSKVSALLVLVFLGFGVLLGHVARSPVNGTLAASSHPVQLVLPHGAPATSSPSAKESSASTSGGEARAAEAEPTPAAESAVPAPAASTPTSPSKSPTSSSPSKEAAPSSSPGGSSSKLPPVKHVFVIMLSDEPYAAMFGPSSTAPYLARTLEARGTLLVHYYAVAHQELANELALLSGQGPTPETESNCPQYSAVTPTTAGANEQVLGNGCVYPRATQTLAGQLSAKHLTWRAYVQGADEAGASAGACAHPALGQPDPTATATSEAYATFEDPFVYFDSVLEAPACASDDVGLAALKGDLSSPSRTPSFAYIAPDRCHDANPAPCAPGAPAGPAAADSFLEKVVPEIMAAKAYKESGLLVITADEAPSSGEFADSSACCGQPQFPNLPASTTGLSPRGGGAVGALLLSPFIKGATTNQEPYNHFSLLRTIEDLFALKHLGYAGLAKVNPFEPAIYSAYTPG